MPFIGFLLLLLLPLPSRAAVVINEVAWMGTAASANAEWMELYNPDASAVDITNWHLNAGSGSPAITLTGSIGAGGYYLLERTSDASVPSVTADLIYTGALTNSGTTLTLTDGSGAVIDQVVGGANWASIGGDNATKDTAQRTGSGWVTAPGTPKAANPGTIVAASSQTTTSTATGTPSQPAATTTPGGTGAVEYIPVPVLRMTISGGINVSTGADTTYSAGIYDAKGNRRTDALVTWSFGDGMRRTGASVFHTYWEPGEYVIVVRATTPDGGEASQERVVMVKDASLRIASVSLKGVSIINESTRTLDLSLWRITSGDQEFTIPEDTHLLAGHTILFPSQVIELPFTGSASLLYPNREVATVFGGAIVQPVVPKESSNQVQTVSTITSPIKNLDNHVDAVIAPEVAEEPAASGAAAVARAEPRTVGLLGSPWTYGLFGIIALAGGAFILL